MARLLFFSTGAPIGGHLRSALTIAEALRQRGHEICFVSGRGPGTRLIHQAGMQHFELKAVPLSSGCFNWRDFSDLKKFTMQFRPDVIQTFLGGVGQLSIIAESCRCRLIATICGGKPARFFPNMSPIIVFSQELKEWLLNRNISAENVHVISGRMKLDCIPADDEVSAFFSLHGLNNINGPIILMICRADRRKWAALDFYFRAAEEYGQKFDDGLFVHIGSGNEPAFREWVAGKALAINRRIGRTVLLSTDHGSSNPLKYVNLADIVVGMGRSAFEGMAYAKPTIILSNEGYGGLVDSDLVDPIAYYNFTARHVKAEEKNIYSLDAFVSLIHRLQEDGAFALASGRFGKDWFSSHLDVSQAAISYEQIYLADNRHYRLPGAADRSRLFLWEGLRSSWYSIKKKTAENNIASC